MHCLVMCTEMLVVCITYSRICFPSKAEFGQDPVLDVSGGIQGELHMTHSNGATKNTSIKLNGAGYTNESGALIIPIVFDAKKARYWASASSTTYATSQ